MLRAYVSCALCAWMVIAGHAAVREPNAFLDDPANTTEQLVAQVRSNPTVADRFMRHYATTKDQVIEYFSTLQPSTLRQAGEYIVYNCLPTGRIRSKATKLKAGTPVWVDSQGVPVLKRSCGNPMIWKLDKVPEPVTLGEVDVPMAPIEMSLLEPDTFAPTDELAAMEDLVPPDAVVLVPDLPDMTFGVFPQTKVEAVEPIVPEVVPSTPSFGWVIPIGLVFPILVGGDGGEPPVPEPSTIVAGIGVLGVLAWGRRRRVRAQAS
jgi:hypothetical protein